MNFKIFLIWFLLIVFWNFVFPDASPLFDVVMAILLSFLSRILEDFIK
tara:strand:+ start:204 stop:347 length:144 start_codon:yes stop_codon:yes gene_type:complete